MTDAESGAVLQKIRDLILQLGEPGSSRYFLYLEIEEGVFSSALFQEYEDKAMFVGTMGLTALILELWHNKVPPYWGALSLDVDDKRVSAIFHYDRSHDDDTDARTAAAVKARFGAKPSAYPTDEEFEQQRYRQLKELG